MLVLILGLLPFVLLSPGEHNLTESCSDVPRCCCAVLAWISLGVTSPTRCLESTLQTRTDWSFEPVANFLPLQLQSKQ